MTKLALIEPNGLSRTALAVLLRTLGFDSVEEYPSVDALSRASGTPAADMVLVNFSREVGSAELLMKQVRETLPEAKVVILAPDLDVSVLARCMAGGASGYLLGNISEAALRGSLHLVNAGGTVLPSEIASMLSKLTQPANLPEGYKVRPDEQALSDREIEILRFLVAGEANKVIAQRLNIAEATVKVHVKHILRKTRARNRTQAALWAVANGINAVAAMLFWSFDHFTIDHLLTMLLRPLLHT
jgi:two-component system, NarL family, nitrate/nitrite response regulator NarL